MKYKSTTAVLTLVKTTAYEFIYDPVGGKCDVQPSMSRCHVRIIDNSSPRADNDNRTRKFNIDRYVILSCLYLSLMNLH